MFHKSWVRCFAAISNSWNVAVALFFLVRIPAAQQFEPLLLQMFWLGNSSTHTGIHAERCLPISWWNKQDLPWNKTLQCSICCSRTWIHWSVLLVTQAMLTNLLPYQHRYWLLTVCWQGRGLLISLACKRKQSGYSFPLCLLNKFNWSLFKKYVFVSLMA